MTLADSISDIESREQTLTVLNRDEPEPIVGMRKRTVDAAIVDRVAAYLRETYST